MDLKLIKDLNESQMYRSKQSIKRVTARQVADHAFMDMMAIWILYNEFEFSATALAYAERTAAYNRFSAYRQNGTDLYLNFHILTEKRDDLLDPSAANRVLLDRIEIDVPNVIRYLRQASMNTLTQPRVRQTLQRLENSLFIENSNYRSIRRLVQNWQNLDTSRKRTALTRMLMFYRVNARRSEMFQHLNQLAKTKGLVDRDAKNPEMSKLQKAAAAGAAAAAGFAVGHRIGKSLV